MRRAVAGRRERLRWSIAGLVLTVLGTTSCSDPNAMQDGPTARPPAPRTSARCPVDAAEMSLGVAARKPPVQAGSIPAAFRPGTVMVCHALDLQNRGGSKIRYTLSTQEAPVVPNLLAALQLPDQTFRDKDRGVCTLEFTPLPYLLLVDQERRAVRTAIPVDACGKIRPEVYEAIATLPLVETSRRTVDDVYLGR